MSDFDDDIQYDDESCPKCGASVTYNRPCSAIGCDDGWIDQHEYDDPLLFDEGDEAPCGECFGTGYHHWCRQCGFDFQDPRNKLIVAKHRTVEALAN